MPVLSYQQPLILSMNRGIGSNFLDGFFACMPIRESVLCLLFCSFSLGKAQSQKRHLHRDSLGNSFVMNRQISQNPFPLEDCFRYKIVTGSNGLPFAFMKKMAFGGYISTKNTTAAELQLRDVNRAGFIQEFSLAVFPLKRRHLESVAIDAKNSIGIDKISIRNTQMAGLVFSKDAYRLLFRGNGYYKGKWLDLGRNKIFSIGLNTIDFGISLPKKQWGEWQFSLSQVNNYYTVSTENIHLFTSENADVISFNGNFYSQSTTSARFTEKGLGITMSAKKNLHFGKRNSVGLRLPNQLLIGFKDLGIYHLPAVKVNSRGMIWSANGRGLKPFSSQTMQPVSIQQVALSPKELQLGNWFNRQRDTALDRLNIIDQERSGNVLSPFTLFVEMQMFKAQYTGASFRCDYVNIPGYIPRSTVTFSKRIPPQVKQKWDYFELNPYVGIGGFDTWDIGCKLLISSPILGFGKAYFTLDFIGIESFIAPGKQHGAGLATSIIVGL